VPHQQVEHTAAPTSKLQSFKKSLAKGGPSTHGETRSHWESEGERRLSGYADSGRMWRPGRCWPKADVQFIFSDAIRCAGKDQEAKSRRVT
jgi:hypothetical protein